MARLFVAVWPPPVVVDALDQQLARPPTAGVRWVEPENWHVTLRFLGPTEPSRAEAALDRLVARPARAVVGPAVTTLGRSIACLPVAGLDRLAAAVVDATAGVGRPPEDRPFRGHLTLARRRGGARVPTGARFEATFDADEVALVASDTRPSGAVYRVLRTWRLPAGAEPG